MKILKVKNLEDAQKLMKEYKSKKPEKLVVKYYMDGCGACEDLEPKWKNVINKLKIPTRIMIADVENKAQRYLPIPSKMGFPTLSIMNLDNKGSFSEEAEHIGSMSEDKLMKILVNAILAQAAGKRRKKTHKKRTRKHKKKGKKFRNNKRKSNKRTRR